MQIKKITKPLIIGGIVAATMFSPLAPLQKIELGTQIAYAANPRPTDIITYRPIGGEYKGEATFKDVSPSKWYYKAVKQAYEYQLISGKGANAYDPNGNLTVAEAITLAAKLHSYGTKGYYDVPAASAGQPWYTNIVKYAEDNGIIEKDFYYNRYNDLAYRDVVAHIFANVYGEELYTKINTVTSIPDVKRSDRYGDDIFLLYEAGILSGSDANGTFKPLDYITRAEIASIVMRMALPTQRVSLERYNGKGAPTTNEFPRVGSTGSSSSGNQTTKPTEKPADSDTDNDTKQDTKKDNSSDSNSSNTNQTTKPSGGSGSGGSSSSGNQTTKPSGGSGSDDSNSGDSSDKDQTTTPAENKNKCGWGLESDVCDLDEDYVLTLKNTNDLYTILLEKDEHFIWYHMAKPKQGSTNPDPEVFADVFFDVWRKDGANHKIIQEYYDHLPQNWEECALAIVNRLREEKGLHALDLSPELCEAARIRSDELAISFSHDRPNGDDLYDLWLSTGYRRDGEALGWVGEDIYSGNSSVLEAMSAWINSPGHLETILAKGFEDIGIGIGKGGTTLLLGGNLDGNVYST